MRKIIFTLIVFVFSALFAQSSVQADTYVKGYYKKNGTYVAPHYRSDRNHTKYDNWSTYGNYNPYTGAAGTKRIYNSYNNGYNANNAYNSYNSYDYSYKKTCFEKYGFLSIEKSDGSCGCVSGYIFSEDSLFGDYECVSKPEYCRNKFGFGADYDDEVGCYCKKGYKVGKKIGGKITCEIDLSTTGNYDTTKDTFSSAGYTVNEGDYEISEVILKHNTNMREAPGMNSNKVRKLLKGEKMLIIESEAMYMDGLYWVPALTNNNEFGFIVTIGYKE